MPHRGELVTHVALPIAVVCSDSLDWGWCVLVRTVQHMFVPIGKGGCASCYALADWLSFKARLFQNIGASSFCIHDCLKKFLDAYPTIVWVLRAMPTLVHRTATVLVLHFWIFLEIHPPLSIHHMSATPLPLFLRSIMIWSSCCSLVFLHCVVDFSIALSLRLNPKCRRFHAPTKYFHMNLDSPNYCLV